MNIPLSSDRPVEVVLHFEFLGPDNHVLVWNTRARLKGRETALVTIVGRTPQEVVKLELEHSGSRFRYPIEIDTSGQHLKKIKIFGGRDHWSQVLRNKAMEVDENE